MFKSLILAAAIVTAGSALANDGGIAVIKTSEIKMREYKLDPKTYQEVEVRRITDPNFKITIKGEQAINLQKLLPPSRTVLTGMYPELAKEYNETFRVLGIYSNPVKDKKGKTLVTGKAITIDCSNGELIFPDNGDKPSIKKATSTSCTLSIVADEDAVGNDLFGGADTFDPGEMCKDN